jgi:hypothetical protein
MGKRCFGRFYYFVHRRGVNRVADIFGDRADKKISVLRYNADIPAQGVKSIIFYIHAVYKYRAVSHVIQPRYQIY